MKNKILVTYMDKGGKATKQLVPDNTRVVSFGKLDYEIRPEMMHLEWHKQGWLDHLTCRGRWIPAIDFKAADNILELLTRAADCLERENKNDHAESIRVILRQYLLETKDNIRA